MMKFEPRDIKDPKALVKHIKRADDPAAGSLNRILQSDLDSETRETLEKPEASESSLGDLKDVLCKRLLNEALNPQRRDFFYGPADTVIEPLQSAGLGSDYHFSFTDDEKDFREFIHSQEELSVSKGQLQSYLDGQRGKKRRLRRLALARAFPSDVLDITRWYVALDLGSESMAAYYKHKEKSRADFQGLLDLQSRAGELERQEREQLMYGTSRRLRNRVSLIPVSHSANPFTPQHAAMDFFGTETGVLLPYGTGNDDAHGESAFRYFHENAGEAGRGFIPNPKLVFQERLNNILPTLDRKEDGKTQPLQPTSLIQHLTTQVFRNFVFHAKNAPSRGWLPEEIHLLVTVPNVYSPAHRRELVSFLRGHSGAGRVSAHHESASVAYYGYRTPPDEERNPSFKKFRGNFMDRFGEEEAVYMLSLDVGRGTADAALWRFPSSAQATDGQAPVARSGNNYGGNRLSYYFVEYFAALVEDAFDAHNEAFPDQRPATPAFDFRHTTQKGGHTPDSIQRKPLEQLEEIIERLKRSCQPDYTLHLEGFDLEAARGCGQQDDDEAENQQAEDQQAEVDVGALERHPREAENQQAENQQAENQQAENQQVENKPGEMSYGDLRADLADALIDDEQMSKAESGRREDLCKRLRSAFRPPELPPERPIPSKRQRLLNRLKNILAFSKQLFSSGASRPAPHDEVTAAKEDVSPTGKLRRNIKSYVEEVVGLIDHLTDDIDDLEAPNWERSAMAEARFALIAGQASQFAPLQQAIERRLRNLGIQKGQHHMLRGEAAKTACCEGAVALAQSMNEAGRRDHVEGYFGFVSMNADWHYQLDMEAFRAGAEQVVECPEADTYRFISADIPVKQAVNDRAFKHERNVPVQDEKNPTITVQHDRDEDQIKLNGDPIGGAGTREARSELLLRLWPESLQHPE